MLHTEMIKLSEKKCYFPVAYLHTQLCFAFSFLLPPEEIKHGNHILFKHHHLTRNCFPGFSSNSLSAF